MIITLLDHIKALRLTIAVLIKQQHTHARRDGYLLILRRILERLIRESADDAGDLMALHILLHASADTEETHRQVKQRLYLLDEVMEFLEKKYEEDKDKTEDISF